MEEKDKWKQGLDKDLKNSVNGLIMALDNENSEFVSTILKRVYLEGEKLGKLKAIKALEDGSIH